MIELYLDEQPSITANEIRKRLLSAGAVEGDISLHTIYRALGSKQMNNTHKKMTCNNSRRFLDENIQYTQAYINELSTRNPHRLKFFDEAGFCPTSHHPTYGWSEKGTRCVEIVTQHQHDHFTLNLMIGTEGVTYAQVIPGATNGDRLLEYFGEATQRLNDNGEPFLQNGDIVVIDNCPTHHGQTGQQLKEYLAEIGVEVIYTPKYSPELNPAEFAFNKIKTLLKQKRYRDLYDLNPGYAIYEIVEEINDIVCRGFFQVTGYLEV